MEIVMTLRAGLSGIDHNRAQPFGAQSCHTIFRGFSVTISETMFFPAQRKRKRESLIFILKSEKSSRFSSRLNSPRQMTLPAVDGTMVQIRKKTQQSEHSGARKRTDEREARYLHLDSWLFWTTILQSIALWFKSEKKTAE